MPTLAWESVCCLSVCYYFSKRIEDNSYFIKRNPFINKKAKHADLHIFQFPNIIMIIVKPKRVPSRKERKVHTTKKDKRRCPTVYICTLTQILKSEIYRDDNMLNLFLQDDVKRTPNKLDNLLCVRLLTISLWIAVVVWLLVKGEMCAKVDLFVR